jgi:hypothetical protein
MPGVIVPAIATTEEAEHRHAWTILGAEEAPFYER